MTPSASDSRALSTHLVDRQRVGVRLAVVVAERAEQAAVAADVGVVDVAVADEVDVVADEARAREVGHGAHGQEVGARGERTPRLLLRRRRPRRPPDVARGRHGAASARDAH